MDAIRNYLLAPDRTPAPEAQTLADALARYPWCTALRISAARRGAAADAATLTISALRHTSLCPSEAIDAERLTALSQEDVIDRFLQQTDLRIVADDDAPEEIATEARLDEEDDLVSEELAEVYAAQGLHDEALAIYRRLSLLNPEKSVYFAEIIRRLETNN